MKILTVAMPYVHFFRWLGQLRGQNDQVHYFDVMNKGKVAELAWTTQHGGWHRRKVPPVRGEYFLSRRAPRLHERVLPLLEVTPAEAFSRVLSEVRPDVVHSFEMQTCTYPLLQAMNAHPRIRWIYSSWGNDLFYYKTDPHHRRKLQGVLSRVDELFTDCKRDVGLAAELGFKGRYLGTYPGGGGYEVDALKKHVLPRSERKTILVKGYEHKFGRGLTILRALEQCAAQLKPYTISIFGAHKPVIEAAERLRSSHGLHVRVVDRGTMIDHEEMLRMAGEAKIYIGNAISDGIPNTLLEAMVMGAFPIQSDPGGATSEVLAHERNGLVIRDPLDVGGLSRLIVQALQDDAMQERAFVYNQQYARARLDQQWIREDVLKAYDAVRRSVAAIP